MRTRSFPSCKKRQIFILRFQYLLILLLLTACHTKAEHAIANHESEEAQQVLAVHKKYIEGWKAMDESQIMSLFVADSRIQPNALPPVNGKENIRAFWFPEDGSVTTIDHFSTTLLGIRVLDTIAVTTHTSRLEWTYTKDTIRFGRIQNGIRTDMYRKQPNSTWKIWRQMWSDIYAEKK